MATVSGILSRLKKMAKRLRQESYALYFAFKDPRTPWFAKVVILIVLGYLLSPVDLIPDFVPVLGYLDDLVIVPLPIRIAIKLIPKEIMIESRARAARALLPLKKKGWLAIVFILIWIMLIWFLLDAFVIRH